VKGPDTDNALLARFYSNTGQRGSFGIRNGVGTNPTTFIGTLGSSENLAIGANNIEVIRVQSSGNVGIGVTGPTARLHVIPTTNDEAFTVTGYSLTGSNAQSMLDLAGTWNTTGAPTAIRLNITDTASAESSGLLDLRVGGASRLFVRKDGKVGIGTTNPATSLDVTGGIKVISFTLPTGAGEGKVLTSDGDGTGFWKSLSEVSGVIGDGLTGQVTFWKTSSEIGGDNDLFWDITNKRLGIGTTSPTGKLEVSHNGTDRDLVVSSTNGRVGIYDPAPANRLSVDGDIAGSGILKISNEGKSYIQGQLAVGSTNPGGVTLDVNGNFKAKELEPFFETTRSSDSTVGQWTKVIDLDFNGQKYSEINTQVAILGRMQESLYPVFGFLNFALLTDGNGNLGAVRLDLSNWSLTNVVSKDDIVFVDTSGGGGTAAGSLYIRIKGDGGRYNAIGLSPLRVYRQGNTLNFLSDQGFISSLPAGTQYSASYADDYVNNLYAYGRIKTGNGSVASPAYSFIEDTDSGLYRLGANKIGLITAGLDTNGITIDSAGNVGIGTMGPISKFQIGRTDTEIQLWSGSTPYVFIQGVDNEVATPALQIKDENQIEMFTISTYADSGATGGRAYFGGNVGIGTNSPTTAKLVINPGTQPSIDAGSQRIINVATPTAPSDAVTKGYVDGASVSHALTADSADYATNAGAADNATYANSSLRATYLGSGFNITTDSQGNLEITGNVTITL